MKRKIISMLMAMMILFTTVDVSVFASETTVSGNEVQNEVEEVIDNAEEAESKEIKLSEESVKKEQELSEWDVEVYDLGEEMGEEETTSVLTYELLENGTVEITGYSGVLTENLVIPETIENYVVSSIGFKAFYGCDSLVEVKIPDTVTSIGYCAFYDCDSLEHILIPQNVLKFTGEAFGDCAKLFTAGPIGGNYNIEFGWTEKIPDYAFEYVESLISVQFPDSITSIGEEAFYHCSNLNTVDFSDNLISIGENAFYLCSKLSVINLPNNVIDIGDYAFGGCNKLSLVTLPVKLEKIGAGAFYSCDSLVEIVIPDTVTEIGAEAFSFCDNLEHLVIPNSVLSIGGGNIRSCPKLLTAGPIGGNYNIEFGWTKEIPDYAFNGVTNDTALTNVTIPSGITRIGNSAFEDCVALENIEIPESVTQIGKSAFRNTGLKNVVLPYGITTIEAYSFADTDLVSVTIPNSVITIEECAFMSTNFSSIIIPNSIKHIYGAFELCNLTDVYYAGNEIAWNEIEIIYSLNDDLENANIHYMGNGGVNFDNSAPTIWVSLETDTQGLVYKNGYNYENFDINISALCMLGLNNEQITYENVTIEVVLSEGLSFSDNEESKTITQNLGLMSLDGTKRQDRSFTVYIDETVIKDEFSVDVKLTADGYETPQTNTYKMPVSIVVEKADETIIDSVERYTSDKEVQEVLDIFNSSLTDEEIKQRLFEYYNYDNMLDVRERIIELSDMHDERWDYEGLIRDDMYLSWQYYDYLNNTPKGVAARVALYASGLVFNGEINEWIDPTTYIDSELPGIKKYKSLLEEFIQKQSSSIELYTYMSEAEKFINSTVGVCSKTEKAEVIKKLKSAKDSATCKSIFNDFVADTIGYYGDEPLIYVYDGEKPAFMEGMGIVDTVFKVYNATMDGIYGLVDISSNLETYQVYHSFLQEIYEADDLPWELVVAAYQLDQELEQAYWTPIQGILNEIRDECLDEAFDAAGFENLLNKNGWLSAINYTAFCINQFVDVGKMVVNSCHTEGYAFLAMHYKNKLEQCKQNFLADKTEENAWAFYEAYVMLWKLRLAGEEKFLQMSNLEGGKVVDGLSEVATGGTIAGLISDLCGYADKEAAVNDNLKMLDGFSFKYSIKDEDLPDEYKYLQKIVIECPVSVEILMADGTQVCVLNDGVETEITNEHGTFISIYRATTGDYAKIAYFNDGAQYTIRAIGQDSGNVTYSSAKTEDHLTCTIEGFDNVIISENDIIHITTDDEKYTIDKEGDGTTDIEGEQADKNKTFVQFDYQDGKQIQVKYVNENGVVTMPETPLRDGYQFKGWFTEPEGLGEEFTTATVINRSMTVYAKWESKETLPTVTANIETGSVVEKTTEIILSCEIEEAQIYYTLDETNPTADSTLYTEPIVLTEATTIKAIAVKEGYNNSEVAVFAYTIAEGETVTFTVTFNSNGGSEVLAQTVEENQKAKEPEKPTRQGYIFKGWYLGDELYDFETPVITDIILEARWEIDESQKKGDILPEDIPSDGIIPDGIWSAGINDKIYTATIVFTGMESGGYTGTKKYTFKITAAGVGDVTNDGIVTEQIQVTFKDAENVQDGIYIASHMKGGAKPEVIVTSGGMTLEPNKDYTISYANNKKPALSTDKNAPSLTVKGKGNFTGSKKIYFTIAPKALTNENGIKVVVNDKIVSNKPNGYRQNFKVYDSDGKALGSADYDAGKAVYTLIETQNEDGTVKEENRILDKKSTVSANSTIRITVPGKGNYAGGEAYATYRILENSHDISKATIQIQNQDYTGNPVLITEQSQFKLGKVYIKIGKETKELILGEDIQVVPGSYVKHVDKGTAKVTFRGINDFGGTKTVSYKIGARSIEEFWKGIQARMARMFD